MTVRMFVTPRASRIPGKRPVAFLGDQLSFFERGVEVEIGRTIEVMIAGILLHREIDTNAAEQKTHLHAILLRPVTSEHRLVAHKGFECSGSMCRTTADLVEKTNRVVYLTPGRTTVVEADNVNVGWQGQTADPLVPGHVWVNVADYERAIRLGGPLRALGLADPRDSSWFSAFKNPLKGIV